MSISAEALTERINTSKVSFSVARMLLRLGAKSDEMRSGMLEFIAVLPSLRSSKKVSEYAVMYLGPHVDKLPRVARWGFVFTRNPITAPLAGWVIRKIIVHFLAPYFIAKNERTLAEMCSSYRREGAQTVVDVVGESVQSFQEANEYIEHLESLIESNDGKRKLHIAVKFSSFFPHFYPANYDEAKIRVSLVFEELLRKARRYNVHITVDVEDSQVVALTEDIFLSVVCSQEFYIYPDVAIALQAYRKDSMASAFAIVTAARNRCKLPNGEPIQVRLVKGAYWDTEQIMSGKNGWAFPLFEEKKETDANFLKIARYLLNNKSVIRLACGTHNPETISAVLQIADTMKRSMWWSENTLEFQVLLGIGDRVWPVLVELGLTVRIFIPVRMSNASLEEVMAYFARRLQENTASGGIAATLMGGE